MSTNIRISLSDFTWLMRTTPLKRSWILHADSVIEFLVFGHTQAQTHTQAATMREGLCAPLCSPSAELSWARDRRK